MQGLPLLKGDVSNGLYRLPSNASFVASRVAYSGVRTTLHGWHQRMAHPHPAALHRIVSSFKLPVSNNNLPAVCEPCQFGKSKRLPFPSIHSSSLKPFDLVYSDVWGPSPCLSLNGHRYFLL
ncbi:Retrovirus-related Pol polyprotein from transposon RE2, partial [Linum grandiflorum]